MNFQKKYSLPFVVGCTLISAQCHATNGMFMIGYGAKSTAMGGAAIANPQDSLAGAVNPATISTMGIRADVGFDVFNPNAKATLGGETEGSRANLFLIPHMAGAMKFSRKMSFGFSAVGAGGGGSRYNRNLYNITAGSGGDPDKTMGVNLMVMQMNPTVSYEVAKNQYIGASPVISIQTFRAFGLEYFSNFTRTGINTEDLTNNGNDYSFGGGLRIGWLGEFLDNRLRIGAAATSTIYMTKFSKYKDLFAEQGDIDTPPNVGIGIAYDVNEKLTVALDITRTFYTEVASISNKPPSIGGASSPSIFPDGEENRLGKDEGLGFGWQDQTIYKLGAAYQYNDKLTLRAGWNYGESPIPEDNGAILVNIVAPAVTQNHLTLGGTYKLDRMTEFSMVYMRAFNFEQYGPTFIGGTGEIKMDQHQIGMSIGIKLM